MICNTIGLTVDSFESIYTTGGTEVEEVYGAIDYAQPIYAKIREMTGTLPLTFTSHFAGNLTDYHISGNTVQDGTPTPDMPVDVVGCGVKMENLFSSAWEQGSINVDTGQNEPSASRVRTAGYIEVSPNKIYSFSRSIYYRFMNLRFYSADKSFIDTGSISSIRLIAGDNVGNPMSDGTSFCCFEIINPNIRYMRIGDESNTLSTKYMMVEGEYTKQTMPKYEPYGYKLPLTINSTEYPIYLGQVETTRRIKKLVLTGEEVWVKNEFSSANRYTTGTIDVSSGMPMTEVVSTHLVYGGQTSISGLDGQITGADATTLYRMYFWSNLDLDAWKSYLAAQYAAGTPVTVWYVLATSETAVINEPLHKISNYADTISFTQASVTIPTVNGENILDMASTVKPSEVYIKGKGIKPM